MRRAAILPALLLLATPHPARAGAGAAVPQLAAHRAVYDLTLKSSLDQGVLAARGSMTYDITDACTGLSTAQHLVINLTDRDGRDLNMVSDYATLESRDGTHLEFHTRQLNGGDATETLDGTAVLDRSGGHGHADYTNPEHKRVPLPAGTLLPNAHTLAILQAGLSGKRFIAAPLFDGTDESGAQDSFVTIEPWQKPRTEKWSALSSLPAGRVHVAFFGRNQRVGLLPGSQGTDTFVH